MKSVEIVPESISLDIWQINESVYHAIIQEYVNYFSQHKGVLFIGQFGSIETPGVSDIDLLVVCKDEHYRAVVLDSQKFIRQSPLHRYLFWHDVAVIPESIVKYISYTHSLENLHNVWGDSDMFTNCKQLDEITILFRNILWNSYFWGILLKLHQQKGASSRLMLMLSKNILTSAVNNYQFMSNSEYARTIVLQVQQDRQCILNASPSEQVNLIKEHLYKAILTLLKSDKDLNNLIVQRDFLSTIQSKQKKVKIDRMHLIVFDNSQECQGAEFFFRSICRYILYLPSFYYTISCLIAQPYLQLQPSLFKVLDVTVARSIKNAKIESALRKWNEVLVNIINGLRKVGADPENHEILEFPFNLKRQSAFNKKIISFIRRLMTLVRRYL